MDAFIITTPAISHFFFKKIIKTNKPIIIEKPLIQNFKEYENLKVMKKKFSKKKILINHSDLYSSGFLNINTYLKKIGPIKEVVMKFGKYQRKYQSESPYFDWLPHPIAIYCYLFGKPSKVKIKKNEKFKKNNYKFQDLHFLLERKNIKAKIHFSNNFKKPYRIVKIIGTKGSIIYNGYIKNHLFFLKNNKRININGNIKKTPIRNLLDKFSDIILEKNKFKNDIMLSFNVMETLFKIQRKLSS